MDTVLQLILYSLLGGVFVGGFLAVLFTASISFFGVLLIITALVLLIPLMISMPFILSFLLLAGPPLAALTGIYCLLRYYPHYAFWIRENLLTKPKHLVNKYYFKPLHTLPNQSVSVRVQNTILGGVIVCAVAMSLLTYGVLTNGPITYWNIPLNHAMREFRSPDLSAFWLKISLLNSFAMAVVWGMITLYFIVKRDAWRAIHWILLGVLVGAITAGLKYGTAIPRPGVVFPIKDAFPSAHVSTHMTLLGGLIILADLHQGVKLWVRLLTYACYGVWVYLIAFSRLYFSAHWLTDLMGGVLVSLISLGIFSLSYYRRVPPPFIHRELRSVSLISLAGLWLMRFVLEYDRILNFYIASF